MPLSVPFTSFGIWHPTEISCHLKRFYSLSTDNPRTFDAREKLPASALQKRPTQGAARELRNGATRYDRSPPRGPREGPAARPSSSPPHTNSNYVRPGCIIMTLLDGRTLPPRQIKSNLHEQLRRARPDILVPPEDIARIVLVFCCEEPRVVAPVSCFCVSLPLNIRIVCVNPPGRVWLERIPRLLGPSDYRRRDGWVVPHRRDPHVHPFGRKEP